MTPRAFVIILVQMNRGLGKLRDRAGRGLAAMLAAALAVQLSLASFLVLAPAQSSATGETFVICGASGVYTITLDGAGAPSPTHASPHCPFCIVAPGLAPPGAPDCARPRQIVFALLTPAAPIARPRPPAYASPYSRAPPPLAT